MKVLDTKRECTLVVQISVYYLPKIKRRKKNRKHHIKILGQINFIRIRIKKDIAILTK